MARFSSAKTTDICLESYISTENMIPFLGGISTASSVPDVKSASFYEEGDILLSNIRLYFCKIWKADKKGHAQMMSSSSNPRITLIQLFCITAYVIKTFSIMQI